MSIPVFRPNLPEEAGRAVDRCLASGWIGYGPECRKLEETFVAGRGGAALATNSCTSALFLAAQLCRRSAEDEVIVPAITFVSTAMAFHAAGYRVRLADVDAEHLLLDRAHAETLINSQTRALVVVHLYGQHADTLSLRRLCDRYGIALVEDCAHRLDSLDEDPPQSDYACYSFNAVKEAPCGEGGLLWSRDGADAERMFFLSNLGLRVDTMQRSANVKHLDYNFSEEVGLKLRLNDIAASMVNASLHSVASGRMRRKHIFDFYDSQLSKLDGYIKPLHRRRDDSYLMYVARLVNFSREQLRDSLARDGIATSVHYPALSDHPLFGDPDYSCVNAERLSEQVITLPCFIGMSRSEQNRVIQSLVRTVVNGAEPHVY